MEDLGGDTTVSGAEHGALFSVSSSVRFAERCEERQKLHLASQNSPVHSSDQ